METERNLDYYNEVDPIGDEHELLLEASRELSQIIKDLERNADRLNAKIEEIRKRRMTNAQ